MTDEECREALRSRHVGRAAVQTDSGPHIVPVTYAVAGDSLFFRAPSVGVLGRNACAGTVAFEIDGLDPASHSRWSVLARGPIVRVTGAADDDAAATTRVAGSPSPGARPGRELYELTWRELSGRRTEPDESSDTERPQSGDVTGGGRLAG